MDSRPDIIAIIPARGNSRGIPRKNLRLLAGVPMIVYTIRAALDSGRFSACYVSTEDPEIAEVSRSHGATVIDRPAELAQDASTSQEVVRHALSTLQDHGIVPFFALLQPTSPLRDANHIRECLDRFQWERHNSAISVTEEEHHPYKSFALSGATLTPLFGKESLHLPRQALPPVYRQNGAIYLAKSSLFLRTDSFFIEPVFPFIMAAEASVDIDTEEDLLLAETLMQRRLS